MTVLALTSVTNFLLAGEVLFLAGMAVRGPKTRFSAAWYWAWFLFLLGAAALIGGIDHGFFEPTHVPRYAIQRFTWLLLAAMTFALLMTVVRQFFPERWQRILRYIALIHLAAFTIAILMVDNFLVVVVNYAPVLLLFLVMNLRGIGCGAGSWDLAAGLLILAAASVVQALGVDSLSPLDHNGLYHLISMIGVVFLYRGGRRLRVAFRADALSPSPAAV